MKKTKKLLALIVALVMLISALPLQSFAWNNRTHISTADLIMREMARGKLESSDKRARVTIYAPYYDHENGGKEYIIPQEYEDAIFSYPEAFRAGSLGPDYFPDTLTGQMYTHPYDEDKQVEAGEWVTLLCDSVNMLPEGSEERLEALAFTLGYILHFCGDMFGHDFINCFAGGVYPDLTSIDWDTIKGSETEFNILLSHMSAEGYLDIFAGDSVNGYYNSNAPIEFITNTFVYNGSPNGGPAKIYDRYSTISPQYTYLVELRSTLYNQANKWRESINPWYVSLVMYMDQWISDLDKATYALVAAFDNISRQISADPYADTVEIVTDVLSEWIDKYGLYALPTPDLLTDVLTMPQDIAVAILEAIGAGNLVKKAEKWIHGLIADAILWIIGIPPELFEEYGDRLESPILQLDHKDNPFDPTGNKQNFFEFDKFASVFSAEQSLLQNVVSNPMSDDLYKVINSEIEAYYNTMVMFKLFLIGPDNFSDFIRDLTGKEQNIYKGKENDIMATSLNLEVFTADAQDAGTDDNIFAIVYKLEDDGTKTEIGRRLLDKSGYNDLESGDVDNYLIPLNEPVSVDRIEISIEQYEKVAAYSGWNCENINVTLMHADIAVFPTIGVGGNEKMDSGKKWDLRFQDAIEARAVENKATQQVTNIEIDIETKDKNGSGTDGNVYLLAFNADYSETKPWVKVLLDKDGYNDFEQGDDDTYPVSLTKYINDTEVQGIDLDKLSFALMMEDNNTAAIGMDIKNADLRLYYGNLQLTEQINLGSYTNLRPGDDHTWYIDIQDKLDDNYISHEPLPTTNDTILDDRFISYMNSLDDSTQWIDEENILWADTDIREKVFLRIFKGFSPEIEYTSQDLTAKKYGPINNLSVELEGKWNGILNQRRNAAAAGQPAPAVTGTVSFSFIDKQGNICETAEGIEIICNSDNTTTATLNNYTHSLTEGVYDIKVTYTADEKQNYSASQAIFEDAITINDPAYYTVTVSSSDESIVSVSGGGTFEETTSVTVEAECNVGYHLFSWQEKDADVSTDTKYTFKLTQDRDLVAVFDKCETELVPLEPADCEKEGKQAYYRCDCGRCYEDEKATILIEDINSWGIIPAKGHSYDEQWSYDENYHWHSASCGHELQKDKEAHYGGTATKDTKAICEVCGQEYGDYKQGFRCDMCDDYEEMKEVPVIGFFYTIVHFFYHLAMYIGYRT